MFRRGEPVPFAFIAEAESFQSNVAPPPRSRPSRLQIAGRALGTVLVLAGLLGAAMLGKPALDPQQQGSAGSQHQEAARTP
ncbi:hypothetical protein QMK19_25585 [Streptomyces sp. H10-C2]|uniref:hypothetical protein n=1 Tax=unclassified Streptomyces TaxID=2593676 RepID=UPI0024BB0599|nr:MULTISPECIES: hypothetical protein [unclassified Streptomyces]MDJ0343276.1 hypothetical protein [Streptomyces sp. PH10-H1]MDJ0372938.1 hypothetical protein [Streptomyces sp. H10-C2]